MNEGVNELAHVAAWWLSHPWQAVGVYIAFLLLRAATLGLAAGVLKRTVGEPRP